MPETARSGAAENAVDVGGSVVLGELLDGERALRRRRGRDLGGRGVVTLVLALLLRCRPRRRRLLMLPMPSPLKKSRPPPTSSPPPPLLLVFASIIRSLRPRRERRPRPPQ